MTIIPGKGDKFVAIIFLLCGAFCIFYLFYSQRLILDNYSFFLTRYSKVILVPYIAFDLAFFGISYFTGFLVPYYKANKYEKAKSNMYSSIFALPIFLFLLILSIANLNNNEIRTHKIVGIIFAAILSLFCIWSFYYNLNTLKKFHRKKPIA